MIVQLVASSGCSYDWQGVYNERFAAAAGHSARGSTQGGSSGEGAEPQGRAGARAGSPSSQAGTDSVGEGGQGTVAGDGGHQASGGTEAAGGASGGSSAAAGSGSTLTNGWDGGGPPAPARTRKRRARKG